MGKKETNRCDKCGLMLFIGSYPFCKSKKTAKFDHGLAVSKNAGFAPITIFWDKNGEPRFPGRSDEPTPKGYVRQEITTIAGYHALRKKMDSEGRSQSKRAIENEQRYFEQIERQNRSDLQTKMRSMDDFWRSFAQNAIDHNNRQSYETERDPGFHMPIFENNSQSYSE